MAKTANINVRIDPQTKKLAEELFSSFGITVTDAINIFLRKSIMEGGLPFEMKQPRYNDETEAAIKEARMNDCGDAELLAQWHKAKKLNSRKRRANIDCIFCKIISGELSGEIVYEDEYAVVFMDIAGDVDGHMLAVPRKHVKNILDCDPDTLNHLMAAVKKVAAHCTENGGYDGVNLLNASGGSAGQSVPHFHIHIIPRKKGDGIDAWPAFPGAGRKLEEVYEELRMTGDAGK